MTQFEINQNAKWAAISIKENFAVTGVELDDGGVAIIESFTRALLGFYSTGIQPDEKTITAIARDRMDRGNTNTPKPVAIAISILIDKLPSLFKKYGVHRDRENAEYLATLPPIKAD